MCRAVFLFLFVPWLLVAAPAKPSIDEMLAQLPTPEAAYISPQALGKPTFHAKDDKGSCEILPGPAPGSAATFRVVVTEKPGKHWETGIKWNTAKGIGPKRDDAVLATFEARCIDEGSQAKGQVHPVLRRSAKPYNSLFGDTCEFGKAWQRFNLVATPPADMAEDGVLFGLNLGLQAQNVEIRDVRLLNFGRKVTPAQLAKAVGANRQAGGDRAVGRELDPALLAEIAEFGGFVPTPEDFRTDGTWQATYGIFTCHGYMVKANKYLGMLHLERTPRADGLFDLKVVQTTQLDAGMRHVLEATIRCKTDALATPVAWTVKSQFHDPEGNAVADLAAEETGPAPDAPTGSATGDWCLFEAVQRLKPQSLVPEFSLLEGLSVRKAGQSLAYRGEETYQIAGEARTFHRYVQTGHGILPTSYWLDAQGRLQVVVAHSRAYLLIPEATSKFAAYSKAQTARYRRKSDPEEQQEAE